MFVETRNKKPATLMISNEQVRILIERAEHLLSSNQLHDSWRCYDTLIRKAHPNPYYFKRRALICRLQGKIDDAIADIERALELDADDATSYWERGALFSHKLSMEQHVDLSTKSQFLENVLSDYKASVERDPTSSLAWLAIMETALLMHDWDDAISTYGACQPYVNSDNMRLIRIMVGVFGIYFFRRSH